LGQVPPATEDDGTVSINVLTNDSAAPDAGETLTVTAVTQGAHGTVNFDASGVSYTPNLDYYGTDTFGYTVSDGNGGNATATVNVTIAPVNDAPAAANDSAMTLEDNGVTVAALSNDADVEGDVLIVTGTVQGSQGTVAINSDGTITYTPNANFNGTDSFTYTASDGSLMSAPVMVSILVAPAPDAPVLSTIGNQTIAEGSLLSLALSASDPDGETLTFGATGASNIRWTKTCTVGDIRRSGCVGCWAHVPQHHFRPACFVATGRHSFPS
jgi:VCBS repeat-containing protein